MRLFLALELGPDAARALVRLQDHLRIGRPVDPDQFHVTLVFLGDVNGATVEALHDALEAMVLPLVTLDIAGIGHFGHGAPRLVYAAVGLTDPLQHLQRKLAQAARGAGVPLERRKFVPHVTLARLPGRVEDASAVAAFARRAGGFRLPTEAPADVVLFQSHLRSDGPLYVELARYPLG